MRIAVFSDAHGNTLPIIKAIDKLSPNAVFFLGDGARHVEDLADDSKIPFYIVKGNCDMGFFEQTQLVSLDGKTFFLAHGHQYNVKSNYNDISDAGRAMGADVVLFGHTHIPYEHYDNGLYMLNPGSCVYPNNGKPSCAYIDIYNGSVVTNIVYL